MIYSSLYNEIKQRSKMAIVQFVKKKLKYSH